jgi:hypothetical protein
MPIIEYAECDVCGARAPLKEAQGLSLCAAARGRDKWFMVNIAHVYCSKECYEKSGARLRKLEQRNWAPSDINVCIKCSLDDLYIIEREAEVSTDIAEVDHDA